MRPIMHALLAGCALLPLTAMAAPALAQSAAPLPQPGDGVPPPRLVIGAPGRCEMTVEGDPRPCSSGLVYVQNAQGVIMLSVQSGAEVTIGFQVATDRQPRPEEYHMTLSRMHTSINGQSTSKEVEGSCELSLSTDGQIWHRAVCRATDRSRRTTVMTFTGNGQPVRAARPGQEGAPQGNAPQGNAPQGGAAPQGNAPQGGATPPQAPAGRPG